MLAIFALTFPFFALIFCGYLATARGWLPLQAIPGLNGFVLYFALPCMLWRFGAQLPMASLLDMPVVLVYLLCALLMLALSLATTLSPSLGWKDAAFGALVAAFPNSGFMGLPLLVALLGPTAAGPVMVTIVVDMVMTSSIALALAQRNSRDGQTPIVALVSTLGHIARNPMPWAILLGAAFSWQQWHLPTPVHKTADLLADAASPVALFTIGAVLARAGKTTAAQPHTRPPRLFLSTVLPVVALKMFLHPLLIALVGAGAMLVGIPLTPQAWVTLVLTASLPSASNVSLLAERHAANNARIASIIFSTTVLAFFSFPSMVMLVET